MIHARRIFTSLYIVITIGATWAAIVSDRVSYPSWSLVGPTEFGAFHHAILMGTQIYLIPPAVASLLMTIVMLWFRHGAIPARLVWFVLVCQLVGAFATMRLAIPLQIRMLHDPASAVPDRVKELIAVDLYWRVIPGVLCLFALSPMTYLISSKPEPR